MLKNKLKKLIENKKILFAAIIGIIILGLVSVICIIKMSNTNQEYLISFDVDGGTLVESITAEKKQAVNLPRPEKENYYFNGWLYNNEFVSSPYIVLDNVTLVASWIKKDAEIFTIHFETNGGNKIGDIKIEKGQKIVLPQTPIRSGYVFVHWEDNKGVVVSSDIFVEEELTLYAIWKEKTIINNAQQENKQESIQKEDNDKVVEKEETENKKENDNKEEKNEDQIIYYCSDSSYTLKGDVCEKTELVDKIKSSVCPDGSNEYSGKCYLSTEINYSCPKGELKYDSGFYYCFGENKPNITMEECLTYRELGWEASYDSRTNTCYEFVINSNMTCPAGYHLSYSTRRLCEKEVSKIEKHICPAGYIDNDKNCMRTIKKSADIK